MGILDTLRSIFGGKPQKTAAPESNAPPKKEVAPPKKEDVKVTAKPKVAYVHLSGCTGCLVSLADSYEKLLDILLAVDQVYNVTLAGLPTISASRDLPKEKFDIALVEGGVCLQDKESMELLKETRERAGLVVALGGCSATGNVLNNCRGGQWNQPQHESFVPINRVVKVDAYVPGCPPGAEAIYNFCIAAVTGDTEYLKPFMANETGGYHCGCDLNTKIIESSLCIGCGTCAASCPTRAIEMVYGRPSFNNVRCIKCGSCFAACPRSFLPVNKIKAQMV